MCVSFLQEKLFSLEKIEFDIMEKNMKKSIFICILTAILVMFSISLPLPVNAESYCPKGDVDNNGEFNVSDLVIFQNWLLGVPEAELSDWKAADLCEDGRNTKGFAEMQSL